VADHIGETLVYLEFNTEEPVLKKMSFLRRLALPCSQLTIALCTVAHAITRPNHRFLVPTFARV
jgi:hypothetical protein